MATEIIIITRNIWRLYLHTIPVLKSKRILSTTYPVSILYKSIAGRYRRVRVADAPITARYRFIKNRDGPMTARYRFIKNASWVLVCLKLPGSSV